MELKPVDLSDAGPDRLRAAVLATIERQTEAIAPGRKSLPTGAQLRDSASAVNRDTEDERAYYFQSILELGYLVASSDGFVDAERHALAQLLEVMTGAAVSSEILELHFRDLEDACKTLGRRERLRRAAADFEGTTGRREALGFAALVAIADGRLAAPELSALRELARDLDLTDKECHEVVDEVVEDVRRELHSSQR
jgi:tellurite resistance protein